ncbi:MAG: hypothetical protein IKJ67_00820 [Bacteroidales bacterium]|nr:hypothetical protein [Bacteroidales bacterium]
MSLKNIFKKKDKQDLNEINKNIPEAVKEKVAEVFDISCRRIEFIGIYQGEEVYDSCHNGPGPYAEGMPILFIFKDGVARIEDSDLCFDIYHSLFPENYPDPD